MGSKHDLLPSHLPRRGLKVMLQQVSPQTVAIFSGLLAGFFIGHLYQQHNQVRLTVAAAALAIYISYLHIPAHRSMSFMQSSTASRSAVAVVLQVVLVEHLYTHGEQCCCSSSGSSGSSTSSTSSMQITTLVSTCLPSMVKFTMLRLSNLFPAAMLAGQSTAKVGFSESPAQQSNAIQGALVYRTRNMLQHVKGQDSRLNKTTGWQLL
jgi:hypothetical protein